MGSGDLLSSEQLTSRHSQPRAGIAVCHNDEQVQRKQNPSVSPTTFVHVAGSTVLAAGGVTFFLYFQLFDIAALRFVSLRTKGKAAMLAVA